jgi:uncharacterized protein involved in type VI secretion and phage assembly
VSASVEETLGEILDWMRSHFFGKYRGTVTEVESGGRGRIKAKVPAVLGDQPTGWCDPCVPYAGEGVGIAFLPEVGAGVWIEFEGGDPSYPIWSGCYWREGEMPEEAAEAKKLILTKSGIKLLLDDDAQSIEIVDPSENTITLDSEGITLTRGDSTLLVADSKVEVVDSAGNTVTLDSAGITLTRGGGKLVVAEAKVEINDGALKVQ